MLLLIALPLLLAPVLLLPLILLPLSFTMMPLLLAVAVPVLLPMTSPMPKAGVTDDCVAKAVERAATVSLNDPFYWATVITTTVVNHSATTTALQLVGL